jgi:hypothetical protein
VAGGGFMAYGTTQFLSQYRSLAILSLSLFSAYFMGLDRKDAPYVSIPLNHVIELSPHAYGCHETRHCLMRKEEMLSDGQDEPVTSMPVGGRDKSSIKKTFSGLGNDPVMNPPSN